MAKTPRTLALATFGLNVRRRREALELTQLQATEKAEPRPDLHQRLLLRKIFARCSARNAASGSTASSGKCSVCFS